MRDVAVEGGGGGPPPNPPAHGPPLPSFRRLPMEPARSSGRRRRRRAFRSARIWRRRPEGDAAGMATGDGLSKRVPRRAAVCLCRARGAMCTMQAALLGAIPSVWPRRGSEGGSSSSSQRPSAPTSGSPRARSGLPRPVPDARQLLFGASARGPIVQPRLTSFELNFLRISGTSSTAGHLPLPSTTRSASTSATTRTDEDDAHHLLRLPGRAPAGRGWRRGG